VVAVVEVVLKVVAVVVLVSVVVVIPVVAVDVVIVVWVVVIVVVVVVVVAIHVLHNTGHELLNSAATMFPAKVSAHRCCISFRHPGGSGLPLHNWAVVLVTVVVVVSHWWHRTGHCLRKIAASLGEMALASSH